MSIHPLGVSTIAAKQADLGALERELLALRSKFESRPLDAAEAEADRLDAEVWRLEVRIAEAPARTIADVAVKLRRLRALEREYCCGGYMYVVSGPLYETALAGLDALAARRG